ncbi:AAA family ATPase [Ornithinimicrobium cryptoxanthini]|uniref:AAA family ATPase n=1 Tax=Ornithinimicrobium cryptoxanthini TaxID=2934161 RepID=A0ABY4YLM3_9MICO|nr:AAA family ATPase [Ornithinimicrobium cryptoxanthini]USQ77466.1 AAA family ATPase [Ornithinimicrobium cryptoxanthini]
MSSVILASGSTDLARRVRLASGDDLFVLAPEQVPTGPAQLLGLLNGSGPVQAVVLDVTGQDAPDASLGLAERFQEQFPRVAVLLVTDRPAELGLAALRAGVRDLVEPTLSIDEMRWALRRAVEASAAAASGAGQSESAAVGRVITVASPKGGVGKTTLATNLAVGLANQSPQGTVLVDLDIQFGDVAAALDLDPTYTLGDVVHGSALQDVMGLKTLLTKHRTGLHVLSGVKSPAEADEVTAGHVSTIISLLKMEFRYVVLDTAPGLGAHTLAALDHTTDLVLVSSLDVPGVRGLRKEMELLDELDLPPATRHIVVNFAERSGGLSVADVEATIGRRVDFTIPRSSKLVAATNRGHPILESPGRDRISRDLEAMVARFSPIKVRRSGFSWGARHRGRDQ